MSSDRPRTPRSRGAAVSRPEPEVERFAALLAAHKGRPRAAVHAFHRWFGKLIPAIPAAALEAFTEPGDLVIDPFCGSGTTLVEALLSGRRSLGLDISPLATLLARVKTRPLPPARLQAASKRLLARWSSPAGAAPPLPDFPNRDHYYPPAVARDLARLFASARAERTLATREWLLALASAINRDVSNADTRHVFPGVSKAMRARIAEGWEGDVTKRLERALRDRLAAAAELHERAADAPEAQVITGSALDANLEAGGAALVVTNPPYVSSIRYVETFKLEAFWLGETSETLRELDGRSLGTERVSRTPPSADELDALPSASARAAAAALAAAGEPRLARVVATWASGLACVIGHCARALRPGGHAVVKVGPSRLRGVEVPSPAIVSECGAAHGLRQIGALNDAYAPGSRSLTTARNWYSGRMDSDMLMLLRREDG